MKSIRVILIISFIISLLACEKWFKVNEENDLEILTEEFKPFNYTENGEQKGICFDIVANILDSRGLDNSIEISSDWEAAMNKLKNNDNVVLFTTSYTENRKYLFQWAGPVAILNSGFVALENTEYNISNYNDAKSISSVGVITGYSTAEVLENEGFQNLTYFNSISDAIQELYEGKIDVIFDVYMSIKAIAQDMSFNVSLLKNLFTAFTGQGYIAFSKEVSKDIVESWQNEIDRMKDEEIIQQITDEYVNEIKAPGRIVMFTEENPPETFLNQNDILSGSTIDILRAIMSELNIPENIIFTNWPNAFYQTEFVPNTMTFSTMRTSIREDRFRWVGPICKIDYCFYVKAGSSFEIQTLNDAKQLENIGTVTAWASEEQLIAEGFTNYETWATPSEVFQKLIDGEIDAAVLNNISINILAENAGLTVDDVSKNIVLCSRESYFAFSLDTDDGYIQDWENAYNIILNNGVFQQIWSKWYPNIDW
ncbi:substrate-binding periplasmic protein [Bacteroidota bacterium]